MSSAPQQRTASARLRWIAGFSYLVLLHLLVAVLVFRTDFLPRAQARFAPDRGDNLHPYVAETLVYHRWQQATAPAHGTIFLGDSITQGLNAGALVPGAVNYGIGHLDTRQLLQILPEYTAIPGARTIVLTLGINDYLKGMHGGLVERYRKLVAALPTQAELIWNGVMPGRHARIDHAAMRANNEAIRALCAERPNCRYVDTWSVFADGNGTPVAAYYLDDGVHLSAEGYRRWLALLQPLMPQG